jgi:PAS domain S-box-containing protein
MRPLLEESRFNRLLLRATLLPLLLMALLSALLIGQILYLLQASRHTQHSNDVIARSTEGMKLILDQETGKRGYFLMGDPRFLEPYQRAVVAVGPELDKLADLVKDNPAQASRIAAIRPLYNQLTDEAKAQIAQRQAAPGTSAAGVDLTSSKQILDDLRTRFDEFNREEEKLREARAVKAQQAAEASIVSALLAALCGGGLLAFASRHQLRELAGDYKAASATVRSQAQAIKNREVYLSTTLQSVGEGVIATDNHGMVALMNREAELLTGVTAAETIGRKLADDIFCLMDEQHPRQRIDSLVLRALREGESLHEEGLLQTPNGHVGPILVSAAPIQAVGEDGETTAAASGVVLAFRDIRDRKQAEEALLHAKDAAESASRTKSLFLANMSHELRTPLNAVIGYSEMLQEEAEDEGLEHFIVDLKKINGAGKHLLALINDILDLSKIEAGKMELYLETFDVCATAQEVEGTVQTLISRKNNTLVVHCDENVTTMHADLTKVRQALFNLLSNAAKFTENGKITLDIGPDPSDSAFVLFSVTDTGIGMNEEQQGRLFQAFSQADTSTTRKYGGTGLGLAITRRFAQMMGGEITVRSAPNEGSTFTLRIPREVQDPAKIVTPEDESREVSIQLETPLPKVISGTVLVIDDDPGARELMRRYLIREGYRVEEAANGREGLEKAKEIKPTAITLDVMMPGMDGWSVLQELKADQELADVPVVMVTMVDDRNLGYALGATEYLTKPDERQRLLSILARYRCDAPAGGCRVLVVEDDEPTREIICDILERAGWVVETAVNGREGLEKIAASLATATVPRLILLDLMMPEMDGFDFAANLRKDLRWRDIPVVVVTAKDLTEEDRRRLNGYVEKIIVKGVALNQESLLAEVRDLVEASVVNGKSKT